MSNDPIIDDDQHPGDESDTAMQQTSEQLWRQNMKRPHRRSSPRICLAKLQVTLTRMKIL